VPFVLLYTKEVVHAPKV